MKIKMVLIIVTILCFSIQTRAQIGFGLDFNSMNFQLTSEKYSTKNTTYLDGNISYNFSKYGIQVDIKYLTQGCFLNSQNHDFDFIQLPIYLLYSIDLNKNINYQLLVGYHIKIPIKSNNYISESFYNHGISGKFLLNYEISEKIRCLSGLEFSNDIGTSFSNNDLLFKYNSIVFGVQLFPFK